MIIILFLFNFYESGMSWTERMVTEYRMLLDAMLQAHEEIKL